MRNAQCSNLTTKQHYTLYVRLDSVCTRTLHKMQIKDTVTEFTNLHYIKNS